MLPGFTFHSDQISSTLLISEFAPETTWVLLEIKWAPSKLHWLTDGGLGVFEPPLEVGEKVASQLLASGPVALNYIWVEAFIQNDLQKTKYSEVTHTVVMLRKLVVETKTIYYNL